MSMRRLNLPLYSASYPLMIPILLGLTKRQIGEKSSRRTQYSLRLVCRKYLKMFLRLELQLHLVVPDHISVKRDVSVGRFRRISDLRRQHGPVHPEAWGPGPNQPWTRCNVLKLFSSSPTKGQKECFSLPFSSCLWPVL
jgi:hypothetical protein